MNHVVDYYNLLSIFVKLGHPFISQKILFSSPVRLKGEKATDEDNEDEKKDEFLSPEDAALMSLPEHLTKSTFKKVPA